MYRPVVSDFAKLRKAAATEILSSMQFVQSLQQEWVGTSVPTDSFSCSEKLNWG